MRKRNACRSRLPVKQRGGKISHSWRGLGKTVSAIDLGLRKGRANGTGHPLGHALSADRQQANRQQMPRPDKARKRGKQRWRASESRNSAVPHELQQPQGLKRLGEELDSGALTERNQQLAGQNRGMIQGAGNQNPVLLPDREIRGNILHIRDQALTAQHHSLGGSRAPGGEQNHRRLRFLLPGLLLPVDRAAPGSKRPERRATAARCAGAAGTTRTVCLRTGLLAGTARAARAGGRGFRRGGRRHRNGSQLSAYIGDQAGRGRPLPDFHIIVLPVSRGKRHRRLFGCKAGEQRHCRGQLRAAQDAIMRSRQPLCKGLGIYAELLIRHGRIPFANGLPGMLQQLLPDVFP